MSVGLGLISLGQDTLRHFNTLWLFLMCPARLALRMMIVTDCTYKITQRYGSTRAGI
jgi:hypothetical protein